MDNATQAEMLTNYAIFCLERQKDVLIAYRKIQREHLELACLTFFIIVSMATIVASIWCAVAELLDTWVPVVITISVGIFIAIVIVAVKVTLDTIHEYKAFIAKANNVYTTLEDIIYIVNRMNDLEEDNQ